LPLDLKNTRIAVVGLGYVGLPLGVAFARHFPTLGFDINVDRITELRGGSDRTREVSAGDLASSDLQFSHKLSDLGNCNVFIVSVPTPIDEAKRPDLTPLIKASETIASVLKPGDVVIYESTVYPGATEEDCVPVLEKGSGLNFNEHFFVGYSPERINPGDKEHRFETIVKVTSGSTPKVADYVDALYGTVVTAGTHKASSIRVAEAAKVIENTQRDVNIALINELAVLFGRLGIDTLEVLEAAGTKWNFLPFRPGLVGGHCIGVDPYYLTHKAQEIGHHPEIILSGRHVNDRVGLYVAATLIKLMSQGGLPVAGGRVLIMGLTFKENCPDLRNTRVVDIIDELSDYGITVDVHDPWADAAEAKEEYNITLTSEPSEASYHAVVVTVGHTAYKDQGASAIRKLLKPEGILYDLKGLFPRDEVDGRL